ncbi:MAG: 2-keto-4-pentenoate hydratase [Devosia indica]
MDNSQTIAESFLSARRAALSLAEFPGPQPTTLQAAYAVQERMLDALADRPVAWKVGLIAAEQSAALGDNRLVGPVARLIEQGAGGRGVAVPLIAGGFAAVEAELALLIGHDIPARSEVFAEADLADYVSDMRIAAEIAGSPLAAIVELGPTAVVSDHGNNLAVVLGGSIADWRARSLQSLVCTVSINNAVIASGSAEQVPGGPLAALSFLVQNLARRGRALKKGDWVSTGAMTGVHPVAPGMLAELDFGSHGRLSVRFSTHQQT